MASDELVSFESAFDEFAPVISKRLFKDAVLKDMSERGHLVVEVPNDGQGGDVLMKVMDPQVSMGYNVFRSDDDYQKWLQESIYTPTDDEVMESLKEQRDGSGA